MIKADFFRSSDCFTSFSIHGHAGYAESGQDIVCAAVTSAVMTVVNGIDECAHIPCSTEVSENEITFNLSKREIAAEYMLCALKLQLEYIKEQFPGTIIITVTEVQP